MENCLNIVEVFHKEEESFDEEKFKFISSKISIATFVFDASMIDSVGLIYRKKISNV